MKELGKKMESRIKEGEKDLEILKKVQAEKEKGDTDTDNEKKPSAEKWALWIYVSFLAMSV